MLIFFLPPKPFSQRWTFHTLISVSCRKDLYTHVLFVCQSGSVGMDMCMCVCVHTSLSVQVCCWCVYVWSGSRPCHSSSLTFSKLWNLISGPGSFFCTILHLCQICLWGCWTTAKAPQPEMKTDWKPDRQTYGQTGDDAFIREPPPREWPHLWPFTSLPPWLATGAFPGGSG